MQPFHPRYTRIVALLAEGVGRNQADYPQFFTAEGVALLAEGVGRNLGSFLVPAFLPCVALLAEGVGRNGGDTMTETEILLSPSSRRAWVEIARAGADRRGMHRSPSSRRAWVEMMEMQEQP